MHEAVCRVGVEGGRRTVGSLGDLRSVRRARRSSLVGARTGIGGGRVWVAHEVSLGRRSIASRILLLLLSRLRVSSWLGALDLALALALALRLEDGVREGRGSGRISSTVGSELGVIVPEVEEQTIGIVRIVVIHDGQGVSIRSTAVVGGEVGEVEEEVRL